MYTIHMYKCMANSSRNKTQIHTHIDQTSNFRIQKPEKPHRGVTILLRIDHKPLQKLIPKS